MAHSYWNTWNNCGCVVTIKMKRYILILSMLYSASLLQAQEKNSSYKYWMTWGFMIVDNNISGNLGYSFSLGDNFYKVGIIVKDDSFFSPKYRFRSVDISIGKRFITEWWQANVFIGPSYVFGDNSISNGNREKYETVGLQSDIQLLFRLADEIGIGVGLWGNANFLKSNVGLNINITIGNGK